MGLEVYVFECLVELLVVWCSIGGDGYGFVVGDGFEWECLFFYFVVVGELLYWFLVVFYCFLGSVVVFDVYLLYIVSVCYVCY